ncbi:MAG: MFS transporter [Rhizobiales bacterium]|nr:MFS transporter [Hyphomicrobiales bacterium]MDQ3560985.1 MFS transporter [Pseudomonadota bacterium]
MTSASEALPSSRWAAFQNAAFMRYWLSRLASGFAVQIQTVAVGWQVYDMTRNPLDLGFVGLSQFLPALALVLVTGAAADRYRRRTIMAVCLGLEALCAAALLYFTLTEMKAVWLIFIILAGFGTARAFYGPAQQSLLPNLVPPEILANAIALSSAGWQIATILGPVTGGLLYDASPELAYGVAFALLLVSAALILTVPRPAQKAMAEPATWETIVAGFRFIWREKIVLGAISLDLFAVLLGGATALLPVYARDILQVDASGLGLLRAGQAIGAIFVALYLTTHSIRDHAGRIMFLFVGVFGLFTVVFGMSTELWLSVLALAVMGGADMVSVYIREILIQLWTPDRVRGRVNAVNMVFIGASNELGEFRAGVTAFFIGAVPAVVIGGLGTVGVAALWYWWFPELRRARHLDGRA